MFTIGYNVEKGPLPTMLRTARGSRSFEQGVRSLRPKANARKIMDRKMSSGAIRTWCIKQPEDGFLGASWVHPWSVLGASWVRPGCVLGASCVGPGPKNPRKPADSSTIDARRKYSRRKCHDEHQQGHSLAFININVRCSSPSP